MPRISHISPAYRPTPGSVPARAVDNFDLNVGQELSSSELASLLGIAPKNVPGALAAVVGAGLLKVERRGRVCYYSQGTGEPLQPGERQKAEEPAAVEADAPGITIALYNDGELFLSGAQAVEGGVLLSSAQAAELREYLLHTGSLIEHLQAVQS